MATNTSHYNLVKPAYTEPADIGVINGDMDLIDSALYDHDTTLEKVENSIAIVATGNTHVAITSSQYVYVKEHTALADGLYTASTNIAANATLSSSNLTAVSGGGMNSLKESVDSLNSNIGTLGTVLNGAWITESTSTTGARVTNSITLTKGTWLAIVTVPVITSGSPSIVFAPNGDDIIAYQFGAANGNGLQAVRIITVSSTRELYGMSGGSSPVTYDNRYFNRGGIRAVKIGL